jgi:TRAP-type C4-dicarboxylate transport system substrate-binding protein
MKKSFLGLATLALVFGMGMGMNVQAADAAHVAKVGSVAPEGTPWAAWLADYKKRTEKEAGGSLKMKLFLGGKLGGEKEMIEDAKRGGSVNIWGGSVGAMAAKYIPELNALELPYVFESSEEVDYVLNEITADVEKRLDKAGFKFIMWSENGWHGYAANKCLKTPADMKGLKMRSQESKVHMDTYKAFGASPVEMPVPEVLSALQTGVVDGYSNTPLFAFATGWYAATSHFSYTQHIYQPGLLVASKKWFNSLPKELQANLSKKDGQAEGLAQIRALTQPLLENFGAAGKTVCHIDAAQKSAFVKAAKPAWNKFSKRSKANKKMLNKILKAKKAYKASQK